MLRLLRFLREIVTARSEPTLHYEKHLRVEWLHGDSRAAEVDASAVNGGLVLRARRVQVVDPPELPEVLVGLVDAAMVEDSRYRALELNSAGLPSSSSDDTDADADSDVRRVYEIRTAFAAYSAQWRGWADTDRLSRPKALLYQALQLMMHDLASRPESVELVLASGLLTLAAADSDDTVSTHLVTQAATIERDVRTGDLMVKLAGIGQPRLEDTQLLTGRPGFDAVESARFQQELSGRIASPLDPSVIPFLAEWADRALAFPVDVHADLERPSTFATAERSTLTASPALLLRTRNAFALRDYYEQMIIDLETEDATVPLGLAQLVEPIEPADRLAWLARTGAAEAHSLAEDPLFPLPANAEQSQIVRRLGVDSGVVVEGPPGTGKTHTIANLMSSLLASGQRVLVTSEKSQALRVLRDKLPPELQELCVSITDLSRGGSEELSRSISRIADRKAAYDDVDESEKIESLRGRRTDTLARRAELVESMAALRDSETVVHRQVSDGYDGTTAAVVRKVMAATDANEWLPGPLLTDRPPLSGAEVDTLRTLIATAPEGRARRSRQSLPRLQEILPNSAELRLLCRRAGAQVAAVSEQTAQLLEFLAGIDPADAYDIRRLCEELETRVREVEELDSVFRQLTDSVLSGEAAHLWSRVSGIVPMVDLAAQSDRFVGAHDVQCSAVDSAALRAMESLAVALESGIEWKGRFRKSEQQRVVEELGIIATVDEMPPTTALAARLVTEHIRALEIVGTASVLLADLRISVSTEGSRSRQVNDLGLVASNLTRVAGALHARDALVERLYSVSPSAPWIRSLDDALHFAGSAGAIATRVDADAARSELEQAMYLLATQIDSGPSPEGAALVTALSNADEDAVAEAVAAYDLACQQQRDQQKQDELAASLSQAAPALYELVVDTAGDPEWDELSWQMSKAWAWRRAREWVTEQHRANFADRLEADLDAVDADLSYLTGRLAAAMAWRDCLERMTAVEVRALQTYREHVSAIGAGAGRYAETFRSAARSAMRDAQSAVPAWVMPLQQVLASIPPIPDSFDVVIVDEASQADISSLFLLYLAPRVIVVGDDRQCAPAEVPNSGTLEDVFTRLDVYLPDLPEHVRATLTTRSSLFSMLRTRFGQVVRLREHFRSMPEIINYSSQQFYGDSPLVPVRQFGADRLPPLRSTFVPDAEVAGSGSAIVNRAEALAIVGQIVKCLADPVYDGTTFGVVVLQGTAQVDEIRNELIKRIGIEQWEDRRLRVGTPPDFQGDERNVVFLSMVVAPGQKFVALTANQYKRRFNVATSRAQDQLWLFHSVTGDQLKRADLRNSLLGYMTAISPAPADPMPDDVSGDVRHPAFDTLFEQRIFLELRHRGYHVNPGVVINNRRIDLVVTGRSSRLAVECDGDIVLSSPARRKADLQREQELKRCGWTFWRVRESEYWLDPTAALDGLWATLSAVRIEPHTVDVGPDSAVSAEWVPVDLDPPREELFAEVALSGSPTRPDPVGDTGDGHWNGWLGSAARERTDMWTMPPSQELPVNSSYGNGFLGNGFQGNGFHDEGVDRRS
ncbi:AAA domain-containing protein [Rhodococcoides yunnanense]|uniref:AAA domain-containing protein n=1 Tax=Rhodococcoides yunnanense TaxID=278209 RepID=UPI0009FEC444|nr:AAA domain-containing protein [Rhodococcus yunnanensis]